MEDRGNKQRHEFVESCIRGEKKTCWKWCQSWNSKTGMNFVKRWSLKAKAKEKSCISNLQAQCCQDTAIQLLPSSDLYEILPQLIVRGYYYLIMKRQKNIENKQQMIPLWKLRIQIQIRGVESGRLQNLRYCMRYRMNLKPRVRSEGDEQKMSFFFYNYVKNMFYEMFIQYVH